jgi:hypothetical protein
MAPDPHVRRRVSRSEAGLWDLLRTGRGSRPAGVVPAGGHQVAGDAQW